MKRSFVFHLPLIASPSGKSFATLRVPPARRAVHRYVLGSLLAVAGWMLPLAWATPPPTVGAPSGSAAGSSASPSSSQGSSSQGSSSRSGSSKSAARNAANNYNPLPGQAPETQEEASQKFASEYKIHNEIEVGGHVAPYGGSGESYDTMVNLHTGPRFLSESTDMRAVPGAKPLLFDSLSSNSFGYGGDPYSATFLNFAKGRAYDFVGSFRRGRSYVDYDLLANPLIPAGVGNVPYLTSPHLFNTVRRMTDTLLTVAPLSPVSLRFGFSQNNSEGPSLSTAHFWCRGAAQSELGYSDAELDAGHRCEAATPHQPQL